MLDCPFPAARSHCVSKEFCTPEVEEEREEAEDNLNGVLYAVAVKTDVEIIVSNLLQQILAVCSQFYALERYYCVRSQTAGERQQICQKEA